MAKMTAERGQTRLSQGAIALALAAQLVLPFAARAQESAEPPSAGSSLMEEGVKLFWRGLMSEMEPSLNEMSKALDDIRPSLEAMGPQLRELVTLMGDVQNYSMPERLPNGDILIRRTAPLPQEKRPAPLPSPRPGPNGEIEL